MLKRKRISLLIFLILISSTIFSAYIYGSSGRFDEFSGTGHTGCHNAAVLSTSGYFDVVLSSGNTVETDEVFTISLTVRSFTEATGQDLSLGFADLSPRGDNALWQTDGGSFDVKQYNSANIDGAGDSSGYVFTLTAPPSTASYTLVADAVYDNPTGGGADDLIYTTVNIAITVVTADNSAPSVVITAPSDNEYVSGSSVLITATADDGAGVGVDTVWAEISNATYSENVTMSGTEPNYSGTWDSTVVFDGTYNLAVKANDTGGRLNNTESISINVNNDAPILSGIIESADPLELGNTETIQVNVTDLSPIDTVLIEIGSNNYTMTNIGGDTYEYNAWIPSTIGVKSYTIYANDTSGNINSISGDITIQDQVQPSLSALSESADPLELGNTETIQINVTDLSPIDTVLIEIGSNNYTVTNIGGDTYEYNAWTPSTIGVKWYTIYANDTEGNLNSLTSSITVEDTTGPTLSALSESADPLELGNTETIQVNVTDLSPIDTVLIEIGSSNYTMTNIGGDTYEYNAWTPLTVGVKSYKIYANDTEGNLNSLTSSITVEDTTGPTLSALSESADPLELGNTETIQVNVTDLSPIDTVLIEIGSSNYTMTNIGGDTYEYNAWTPLTVGVKSYTIYANDTSGNINSISGDITVQDIVQPSLSALSESADPIELGNTETIQVNVTDLSPIDTVLIEIGSSNYTMTNIGGDTYEYNAWTPSTVGVKSYTIYANDTSGNINSISGDITVEDTTGPTLSALSESADPLELGNTETIQVNVTDLSPIDTVLIEIGSSNYTMTNIGGDIYEYNLWTPSTVGVKSYTIYANDTSGNINSISSDITVEDTTAPIFSNLIESADPLPLGQNETIYIDVFDVPGTGINQVLLEYETTNHTMNFIGGNTWEWTTWQPSSTGLYTYIIYMEDNANNLNSTSGTINVIVSGGPILENLTEITDPVEFGNSATIQIDASDADGVSIVLIEIELNNFTMTNIGGNTYEYLYTPTSVGTKLYTIHANDTFNNWNQLSNSIVVQDTITPEWANLTESADPLELGSIETITIDASDLTGIQQVLIEIGLSNDTMTNIGGNTYEYNIWTPSTVGIKTYTIYIEDNNNNWNSTSGTITVVDTIDPILSALSESADPLELGNIETIQVNVTDLSPIDTVLIEIGSNNYTMTNIGGDTYEYNAWTPSTVGVKSYTIYANDTSGNINSISGDITVEDITGPTLFALSESADPLELGNTETIQVNITDLSPIDTVLIEIGSNNYTMTNIGGNTYEYNIWTPSTIGVKSYTIYANDTSGNMNSINSDITVEDTTDPTLSALSESTDPLELGNTETIQVNVTDLSPIDTVLIEIGSNNYTMTNIGGDTYEYNAWTPLTVGVKSYTIYANDTSGNMNSISSDITVEDTTDPTLSALSESADPLELGNTETIQVNVTDLSPIDTVLIEIGSSNYTMTNIGGDTYEYNAWTPSTIGVKTYTIYANDTSGNINSISSDITVEDTSGPTLSALSESADPLELGNTETIQVNVTDLSPIDTVLIEIGSSNYTMTNIGGDTYEYNAWTPLTVGVKSYTIYANNTSGNINLISGDITVEDTTGPTLSALSESADPLELGNTETIQVNVTDLSPIDTVLIEIGSSNYTMTNIGGNTYEYNVWTPSTKGVKSYTIYANDTSGNINSISSDITVEDTTDPTLSALSESTDPLELGNTETIQVNVTDLSPIDTVLIEIGLSNYTMTNIGGDTYEYNLWTPSTVGVKSYTIYANDTSGNINSISSDITVQDTTGPSLSGLIKTDPLVLPQTAIIQINVTDFSGVDAVLIEIGLVNYTMTNIGGDTYEYNTWTPVTLGIHNFVIYANDTNNYWNSLSDSIFVIETTPPIISNLVESSDLLELGTEIAIQINVTDNIAIDTVLIEISGIKNIMNNIGGDTFNYSYIPNTVGTFNYIIYANDSSGNTVSITDAFTVQDTLLPSFSNLSESVDLADPGDSIIITLDATDISGIQEIIISFEGFNYTMTNTGGDTWNYTLTAPDTPGAYHYIIYVADNNNNINSVEGSIRVRVTVSGTPGELTDATTIQMFLGIIGVLGIANIVLIFKKFRGGKS